ncbi:Zinc finger, RING/FYVE/PHD-type [Pacmanvirus A23]|uniref:Zinc finger, RING/FYVE/PHD-type n=1 Tax=Pacmanvirus A23 TaxID=1932881 RepID=UPI000A094044|nr:Zinc finger, RING/FYVE/PHD-type [Pacmanvirus A23]SIP86064.1 Zinc finger, RING/FYVE/PHD-type [Pacmanvirus A23]
MNQLEGLQYDPEIMELYKKYVPMPDDGNIYILMGIDWLFKWVIYKYKCVCNSCNATFFDEVNRDTCRKCKSHVCQYVEYKKYDPSKDKNIDVIGCICGSVYNV